MNETDPFEEDSTEPAAKARPSTLVPGTMVYVRGRPDMVYVVTQLPVAGLCMCCERDNPRAGLALQEVGSLVVLGARVP